MCLDLAAGKRLSSEQDTATVGFHHADEGPAYLRQRGASSHWLPERPEDPGEKY